jgi:hypothetical protein
MATLTTTHKSEVHKISTGSSRTDTDKRKFHIIYTKYSHTDRGDKAARFKELKGQGTPNQAAQIARVARRVSQAGRYDAFDVKMPRFALRVSPHPSSLIPHPFLQAPLHLVPPFVPVVQFPLPSVSVPGFVSRACGRFPTYPVRCECFPHPRVLPDPVGSPFSGPPGRLEPARSMSSAI